MDKESHAESSESAETAWFFLMTPLTPRDSSSPAFFQNDAP
jgi:hypothetical protein